MNSILRLGLVAAEPSGDRLGAGVVDALRRKGVTLDLVGIGGPELINRGLNSRCDIHDLSMMGIDDIFRKLPKAFNVRRKLLSDLIVHPPDVFLGIDAPDFNLSLERKLKAAGHPILHLVSPTVWAWRQYRVRKIRKAVDRMLVLFPFEETFYSARGVPATFVGHPAAAEMKLVDKHSARAQLGFESRQKIVAVLPGSRESEIRGLGKFLWTQSECCPAPTLNWSLSCLSQVRGSGNCFWNMFHGIKSALTLGCLMAKPVRRLQRAMSRFSHPVRQH